MSVLQTEELQNKVPTWTLAFIIVILMIGFGAGWMVKELQAQGRQLELRHEFAIDEIGGLRSDMNREVQLLRERIDKLEKK